MSRAILTAFAAAFLLLAPAAAHAQKEPERTKELKEAEKFVASAALATDSAERISRFQRALNPLQEAMRKDPSNARVWLTAAQVYNALGDYMNASAALEKAEQLYPGFKEEIDYQRVGTWMAAFNAANSLMDAQKYPEAIAALEKAETVYGGRPESKINLGALYMNQSDLVKAEAAFRSALKLIDETPDTAWKALETDAIKRYREMSVVNLAQIVGQRGVKAFEAEKYEDAEVAFREAMQLNPHSRDYTYNLAQSYYARARQLDQKLPDTKGAEAKQMKEQITKLYTELVPLVERARLVDPNNEDLYLLEMRSYKVRSDLAADAKTRADFVKRASDLLELHQKLEAEVLNLSVGATGGGEGTIRGEMRNLKLPAGAPVKLRVTLLGLSGNPVGEQEIPLNAPAAEQTVPFEGRVKLTGDIAAWKYELLK